MVDELPDLTEPGFEVIEHRFRIRFKIGSEFVSKSVQNWFQNRLKIESERGAVRCQFGGSQKSAREEAGEEEMGVFTCAGRNARGLPEASKKSTRIREGSRHAPTLRVAADSIASRIPPGRARALYIGGSKNGLNIHKNERYDVKRFPR